MRRRAAAGLAGAGRQALAAGVDLARRPLLPALRPGGPAPGARREHAVLPVEPRRPPPHRRGPARRASRRRGPRPGGPRLQQLDAPVVRRPRAGGGLRVGVRSRGRAGPRRLGALLALPRAREVRRAAGAPAPLRRPRAHPRHPLPRPRRRARRDGRPGEPVPRDPGGPGRLDPARQLTQLRPAGLAAAAVRAGRAQRRAARAVRAAAGVAGGPPAVARPAGRPPGRAPSPPRRDQPAAADRELRRRRRGCSASSPGRTSATGSTRRAAARSPSAPRR